MLRIGGKRVPLATSREEPPVYTFQVAQLTLPLFGVVEASRDAKEPFWKAFAGARGRTTMAFDECAAELIADELGLDVEGLLYMAHRYCAGKHRRNSRGLSGGALGDFGEVVAFLVSKKVKGRRVLRVESWKAPSGKATKGESFPQPDFLVQENGAIYAMEVKSSEAIDFQKLVSGSAGMTPCSKVAKLRREALRQLGYVNGEPAPQSHDLVVRASKKRVSFPADHGMAVAVLVQDGRAAERRTDDSLMTPHACAAPRVARNCWKCLGHGIEPHDGSKPHDVFICEMRNEPGHLDLLPPGEAGAEWFAAYRRWSHALWARHVPTLMSATKRLGRITASWLDAAPIDAEERARLRGFWGSYLHDVVAGRGTPVSDEYLGGLPTIAKTTPELSWRRAAVALPAIHNFSVNEFKENLEKNSEFLTTPAYYSIEDGIDESPEVKGVCVQVQRGGWSLTTITREGFDTESVNDESAERIKGKVFDVAKQLNLTQLRDEGTRLQAAKVMLGEEPVRVGWVLVWGDVARDGQGAYFISGRGAPRLALWILPDGRARMSYSH